MTDHQPTRAQLSHPRAAIFITLAVTCFASRLLPADRVAHAADAPPAASFHDLGARTLTGQDVPFKDYAGKVVLAVNVASQCGYTPQYQGLQKLSEALGPKGLVVVGFPSNEFGGQEPGSAEEIQTFCKRNYGVTFPMFQKLVTKPGPDQSPIYRFLTAGREAPGWNFCKYLVGKDGKVVAFFPSKVAPEDRTLREAIETALTH
ncbi:MAG: glutathione peroxidase [Deltaproteobacteria bacterium]|jgi:glutathione peroxidase|nr:glutathione peroxidase [Deltaproteobacteria bacterium]